MRKTLAILRLSVDDEIIPQVFNIRRPDDSFERLRICMRPSRMAPRILPSGLSFAGSCPVSKWGRMCEFIAQVRDLANQLGKYGGNATEEEVVNIVVNSLPPSFDSFETVIGVEFLPTLDERTERLQRVEDRRKIWEDGRDEKSPIAGTRKQDRR
ncbi:hypothetical protein R1flu_022145 [Riccia fluitans]|uniref:Uncharacterized protein n=1 Tax=Riccia fluitans TaxID=41844 RepID=A0ABD1ZRE7_9MARC